MGKHIIQRMFRDLLSLHGYPLPFESIERVAGKPKRPMPAATARAAGVRAPRAPR